MNFLISLIFGALAISTRADNMNEADVWYPGLTTTQFIGIPNTPQDYWIGGQVVTFSIIPDRRALSYYYPINDVYVTFNSWWWPVGSNALNVTVTPPADPTYAGSFTITLTVPSMTFNSMNVLMEVKRARSVLGFEILASSPHFKCYPNSTPLSPIAAAAQNHPAIITTATVPNVTTPQPYVDARPASVY